jgi:hypothetical protein
VDSFGRVPGRDRFFSGASSPLAILVGNANAFLCEQGGIEVISVVAFKDPVQHTFTFTACISPGTFSPVQPKEDEKETVNHGSGQPLCGWH